MEQHVEIPDYKPHCAICNKCNGKHLQEDGKTDQKAVIKEFGIIPNPCVPDQDGTPRCPLYDGK